ncbi:MAG TPA: glycosyltransferase family 87 protein [Candidatus Sulfotelmatobacter sp.]|nr:glycosyltransferase family 87 protein [Candidatus Sulfotelmatobacter sp.]
MPATGQPWLTAKRLRAHGLIVGLVVWSIYVWNITAPGWRDRGGSLKGGDFAHLYVLGKIALEHRGTELYDIEAQKNLMAERVPSARGIYYYPIYPPQTSILMALFASLSYGRALVAWLVMGTLLYAACCFGVWRSCPVLAGERVLVAVLAAAFPGFFQAILWGQTSVLALACFTLVFLALRKELDFWAGIALGLLAFKPQLGVAAAVVFLAERNWKVIAGAVLSGVAEFFVAWMYYGWRPLLAWLRAIARIADALPLLEPKPYQTHSLRIFWSLLYVPRGVSLALYFVSAAIILYFTVVTWRSDLPMPVQYASLLFATVLVSPHLIVYDMVVLAPAFLLLADWLIPLSAGRWKNWMLALLYAAYLSPLIGSLTQLIRVQLSVVAMAGIVFMIWRASRGLEPDLRAG